MPAVANLRCQLPTQRTTVDTPARAQDEAPESGPLVPQREPGVAVAPRKTKLRMPSTRVLWQSAQLAASMVFVVLYVWSTYTPPEPHSLRAGMDVALCALFAADYALRFSVSIAPVQPY